MGIIARVCVCVHAKYSPWSASHGIYIVATMCNYSLMHDTVHSSCYFHVSLFRSALHFSLLSVPLSPFPPPLTSFPLECTLLSDTGPDFWYHSRALAVLHAQRPLASFRLLSYRALLPSRSLANFVGFSSNNDNYYSLDGVIRDCAQNCACKLLVCSHGVQGFLCTFYFCLIHIFIFSSFFCFCDHKCSTGTISV